MKRSQLIFTLILLALLLGVGFVTTVPVPHGELGSNVSWLQKAYGAVPWYGWAGLVGFMGFMAIGVPVADTMRRRGWINTAVDAARKQMADVAGGAHPSGLLKPIVHGQPYDGPNYPHPAINQLTCIGCHACVDACPHDVLAIVNGISTPIALDQCMEDTSCQIECPTQPKSCVVVNTKKIIPKRKVPERNNSSYMTNVPGIYLIGDVSGTPLIKNAINEGRKVVEAIVQDLKKTPGSAEYDVAVVGIGPGGISATAVAHENNLKYVAIEMDKVVATIQRYPAGKYVFFKPDGPTTGGVKLEGAGNSKEAMIGAWLDTVTEYNLKINEFETVKAVSGAVGAFSVKTEQEKTKQQVEYKAKTVIIAVGGMGTPMKLKVDGEELSITVTPTEPTYAPFCVRCGTKRDGTQQFCTKCGNTLAGPIPAPFQDTKVKYRLSDPNDYSGKHCVVVGAGNSAIEAAVDLACYRSEDGTKIIGWRDNTVGLVVRSDFKGDLKLGNKMLCYECMDEGKLKVFFRKTIKEITPTEVALMSAREKDPKTAKDSDRFRNDYIIALIGGEKPVKFLESMGIKVG